MAASRSRKPALMSRRALAGAMLALGLPGCGDQVALDGLSVARRAQVASVISGDTLEIDNGERVRLAGVEAPRRGDPYADEAADVLARLAEGRQVELLFSGAHTDPFGRTTAQARVVESRTWLEGALLDAGAVRVRTYPENRALAKVMLAREAKARAARRGLWALDDYRVRLPEELNGGDRGLVIVEGRVEHAGRLTDGGVYLDLGQDWRSSASAEIPKGALREFRSAGINPMDLQGRLIRIRGAARGMRLTLDHPEQMERLKG